MSQEDRQRWDKRFAEGAYQGRDHPSALLQKYEHLLTGGSALDVACGAGRNTRFLLDKGYRVSALDISEIGLGRLTAACPDTPELTTIRHDLDNGLPALDGRFELIIKMRFLNLALIPGLCALLAPGGLLFCEMFLQTELPDTAGPGSQRFRVESGALEQSFGDEDGDVELIHCYEGPVTDPDGRTAVLAQLVARQNQMP